MYNRKNLRCRLKGERIAPGSSKQVLVWVIRALNAMSWRNMVGLLTIRAVSCIHEYRGFGE